MKFEQKETKRAVCFILKYLVGEGKEGQRERGERES